jgi:hypothetical protein
MVIWEAILQMYYCDYWENKISSLWYKKHSMCHLDSDDLDLNLYSDIRFLYDLEKIA